MKYSSPPCEHGVGHEPWQILLLLVEDKLEVVAGVALVQRQRHRLELLLALQGVQVHVEDARPEKLLKSESENILNLDPS